MKSPSLPEYLVQYVNFLVDFLVDTKICCEPYQDKRIIEKDLLTYAFFSTVIVWIQMYIICKIGQYYGDNSALPPYKLDYFSMA